MVCDMVRTYKGHGVYSSSWEHISELRGVTCHMGSHPTQVNAPLLKPSQTGQYSATYPGGIEG